MAKTFLLLEPNQVQVYGGVITSMAQMCRQYEVAETVEGTSDALDLTPDCWLCEHADLVSSRRNVFGDPPCLLGTEGQSQ